MSHSAFHVIQAHRSEYLLDLLLVEYQTPIDTANDDVHFQDIFAKFVVIVPSMVLGEWLSKTFAEKAGISTLVTTTFWGQYQWQLMQDVLRVHNAWLDDHHPNRQQLQVPEVAVLSQAVMQWRLFGYLSDVIKLRLDHPTRDTLAVILSSIELGSLSNHPSDTADTTAHQAQIDTRLWQVAVDIARAFTRYLTHREDWLVRWSQAKTVDVEQLIEDKDNLTQQFEPHAAATPQWLVEHYKLLEAAQRHLWQALFADVFIYRQNIEQQFWHALKHNEGDVCAVLPKKIRLFTIQQLPQIELDFLKKLSKYSSIQLYHYNPSQLYWADIVDKAWLERQQIINPHHVYLREYGHTLLSRLGKQSRDTFAMLADMTGNDEFDHSHPSQTSKVITETVIWEDRFIDAIDQQYATNTALNAHPADSLPMTLLEQLQYDVLMLEDENTPKQVSKAVSKQLIDQIDSRRFDKERRWQLSDDDSIRIHSCHSLQRQLEVLRLYIGRWLNQPNGDGSVRHVSDIVVLMPNVEQHHDLIRSVFVTGRGADGLTLPAKITGVVDTDIRRLWTAISGFYRLLGVSDARFEAAAVYDWLMLSPVYRSFGLSDEQMRRGCDLLTQAGFIRGFDEQHLKQSLDISDDDYRFSFAYALDRLVFGLIMPQADKADVPSHVYHHSHQPSTEVSYHLNDSNTTAYDVTKITRPLAEVSLSDGPIIEALCGIYQAINDNRHQYQNRHIADYWLDHVEHKVIHRYFSAIDQTKQMRAIYSAINSLRASLRANQRYRHTPQQPKSSQQATSTPEQLPLTLPFVLTSIESMLESQQVSAEPTGVITFGRFGSLRSVPFGLVVMLNMNLSEFPNRDRNSPLDLMPAGLSRRGDRFSEDDDNGAFLDALLCARSACWMFYNGHSVTDDHEHLPANPVTELIEFLAGKVHWQVPDIHEQISLEAMDTVEPDDPTQTLLAKLPDAVRRWLIIEHPVVPFSRSAFERPTSNQHELDQISGGDDAAAMQQPDQTGADRLLEKLIASTQLKRQERMPPAKLWHAVYRQLYDTALLKPNTQHMKSPIIAGDLECQQLAQQLNLIDQAPHSDHKTRPLPHTQSQENSLSNHKRAKAEASNEQDFISINIDDLSKSVRHPAFAFVKSNQLKMDQTQRSISPHEPLKLDHLSHYQLRQHLLDQQRLGDRQISDKRTMDEPHDESSPSDYVLQALLPVGAGRLTTAKHSAATIKQLFRSFQTLLINRGYLANLADDEVGGCQLITPVQEQATLLSSDLHAQPTIQIKAQVPRNETLWLNVLPNSASPKHLLRFWLLHLSWQVIRHASGQSEEASTNASAKLTKPDNPATNPVSTSTPAGTSIWQFAKSSSQLPKPLEDGVTFCFEPMAASLAQAQLRKWAHFAQSCDQCVYALLPNHAMYYLYAVQKNDSYRLTQRDYTDWLYPNQNVDVLYDTCAKHPVWRFVFEQQADGNGVSAEHGINEFDALSAAVLTLAKPLYASMIDHLHLLSH